MTTLARLFNLADAELLKVRLEAQGIPVFLAEEASFTAGYGAAAGALRVQVSEADAARARELLTQAPTIELPDDFEIEGGVPAPEPAQNAAAAARACPALLGTDGHSEESCDAEAGTGAELRGRPKPLGQRLVFR